MRGCGDTLSFESPKCLRPPPPPSQSHQIFVSKHHYQIGDKKVYDPSPKVTPKTFTHISCPNDLNQLCMKHKAYLFIIYRLNVLADYWSVYFSACIFILDNAYLESDLERFINVLRGSGGSTPRSHSSLLMTRHL